MYTPENAITMKQNQREHAFRSFREISSRLDAVIEALYQPELYTLREYVKISSEYQALQIRSNRLEAFIRSEYPLVDIDQQIAWMKSFPEEEMPGEN